MTEDRIIKLSKTRGIRQHFETHEMNWFLIEKMVEEGRAEWVDGYLQIVTSTHKQETENERSRQ